MTERILGSSGGRRRRRFLALFAGAVLAALSFAIVALANHPEVSLTGSDFEIDTDANLKVDDPAPSIDWASVTEVRRPDTTSGPLDESFGQGTKEDTAVPTVVDGGIPPNKSDLKFFGVYQEGSTASGFLNLFWSRVQAPQGTTNMDFELNRRQCTPNLTPADPDCSANGITPIRSAGDILIQYDLAQGGTTPQLFLSRWVTSGPASQCEAANKTPCWGTRDELTGQDPATADGAASVNTSTIADDPATTGDETDGLGTHDPFTFGEAQVKLSAIIDPNTCESFGSAYLKSRSSDSFTAALKDFVPPAAININTCGAIEITKTRKHAADATTPNNDPHEGVTFKITGGDLPAAGVTSDPTDANGKTCVSGLDPGVEYTVTENVPTGYKSDAAGNTPANSKKVTVNSTGTCASGAATVAFHNTPLTDITVTVNSQVLENDGGADDGGGTASTIDCDAAADPPFDKTVPAPEPDNGDGSFTLSNKEPGTYVCTIVVDP